MLMSNLLTSMMPMHSSQLSMLSGSVTAVLKNLPAIHCTAAMIMFRRPRRKVSRLSLHWQVMLLRTIPISVISRLMKQLILSPDVRKVINPTMSAEREQIEYKPDSIKTSVVPVRVLQTVRYNPVRKHHTCVTMIKCFGSVKDMRMNKPESSRIDTDGGPASKAPTLISNLISERNA